MQTSGYYWGRVAKATRILDGPCGKGGRPNMYTWESIGGNRNATVGKLTSNPVTPDALRAVADIYVGMRSV